MSFKPTDEQQAGIDAKKSGENVVLEALAGTGKTTTLKQMALSAPRERGLYLAYNKAIKTDAAKSFPKSVRCVTSHGLAFGPIGKHYRHKLDAPMMSSRDAAKILGISDRLYLTDELFLGPKQLARLALDTVMRFCYSADDDIGPQHVPFVDNDRAVRSDLTAYAVKQAKRAWADLTNKQGKLGWNRSHDFYLKLWALSHPTIDADYIQFDEAQDANLCTAGIVLEQTDAQLIAVGDRNQAIYGWRGASDAMQNWPAAIRLPLTKSFRFGPAVAEEANKWLQLLESDLKVEGFEEIDSVVGQLDEPEAVLCRTNATVVAKAMTAMEAGRSFAVVGGTGEIRKFAYAVRDLMGQRGTDHPDLMMFQTWQQVKDHVAEDDSSGLKVFVNMIDTYGVEVIMRVAESAVEEKDADVICSTAHKAKGREWGAVQIAADFAEPVPDEETGEQKLNKPDMMLAYVSVTRAMRKLDNTGLSWVDRWLTPEPEKEVIKTPRSAIKQGVIARGRRKARERKVA